MKLLLLVFLAVFLSVSAIAGPKPAGECKKSFYTTPIKEFKGTAFFQWKKFEAKSQVSKTESARQESQNKAAAETSGTDSFSAKKD